MKILSGFILPDSGEILLDGKTVVIRSPAEAISAGIGMLHQDPLDFPPMKLLDNFILGREGGLFPDRRGAARDFRGLPRSSISASTRTHTSIRSPSGSASSWRSCACSGWAPGCSSWTSRQPGISQPQKEKLFATLKTLASQGMTVIFVSHKLEDVEYLCSQVAVLRQGTLVGTADPPYETQTPGADDVRQGDLPWGRTQRRSRADRSSPWGVSLEGARLQIHDVDLPGSRGRGHRPGRDGRFRAVPASFRMRGACPAGGGQIGPADAQRHGAFPSQLQETGRGIPAGRAPGAGPRPRPDVDRALFSPESAAASSSTGAAAADDCRGAHPPTTSREPRRTPWSPSPAETSSACCLPSCGRPSP